MEVCSKKIYLLHLVYSMKLRLSLGFSSVGFVNLNVYILV